MVSVVCAAVVLLGSERERERRAAAAAAAAAWVMCNEKSRETIKRHIQRAINGP